jgi:serpin B
MMLGGSLEDPFIMDYYCDNDIQILNIPFKNNSRYEMACIMPKHESCDELLSNIDDEQWNTWMDLVQTSEISLEMPKFEASYKYMMNEPLSSLGLSNLFYAPDLSRMFDEPDELLVSKVLQDTYISVDEAGAEAAAVTVIVVDRTSAGPSIIQVKLDHPFIYAIQDSQTNAIVFIGIMKDPTA